VFIRENPRHPCSIVFALYLGGCWSEYRYVPKRPARAKPGRSIFDLAALVAELETLLGRRVDVVPDDAIYWLLRRRILSEAQPL